MDAVDDDGSSVVKAGGRGDPAYDSCFRVL